MGDDIRVYYMYEIWGELTVADRCLVDVKFSKILV